MYKKLICYCAIHPEMANDLIRQRDFASAFCMKKNTMNIFSKYSKIGKAGI